MVAHNAGFSREERVDLATKEFERKNMVKKFILGFSALLSAASLVQAADYYLAPTGSATASGTEAAPFFTLNQAVSVVAPGDTIYMRGGTYFYNSTQIINQSGGAESPIRLFAYPGEHPVLNFTNQPDNFTATEANNNNRGILIKTNASYWHIKGLEISWAGDNGMKVEGSHVTIELCTFHHNGDTGLQIGFGHTTENPGGLLAAFILVTNCDSYLNFDFKTKGGDADGFAAKMHCGQGIVFSGCRSWHNSDDGWDLFETDYGVTITNCWQWHSGDGTDFMPFFTAKTGGSGSFQGNGNGLKLGGDGAGGPSLGIHVVANCVAFNNKYKSNANGITQNSHHDGQIIYNTFSFSNAAYNFFFEDAQNSGKPLIFKNCIAWWKVGSSASYATNPAVTEFPAGAVDQNNSWNLPVSATGADFATLTEEAAGTPRQADGSLPNNGFARLVAGSDLIDKGQDVGTPSSGAAPDLGAFEFGVGAAPVISFEGSLVFQGQGGGGSLQLKIKGLTGHGPVIVQVSSNLVDWTSTFTNPPVTGSLSFADLSASGNRLRFYRAQEL